MKLKFFLAIRAQKIRELRKLLEFLSASVGICTERRKRTENTESQFKWIQYIDISKPATKNISQFVSKTIWQISKFTHTNGSTRFRRTI